MKIQILVLTKMRKLEDLFMYVQNGGCLEALF